MPQVFDMEVSLNLEWDQSNKTSVIKDVKTSLSDVQLGAEPGAKGAKAKGDGGKVPGLLQGITKALGPLAILLSLEPIKQAIDIIVGLATIGLLIIFKVLKAVTQFQAEAIKWIRDIPIKAAEAIQDLGAWIVEKLIDLKVRFVEWLRSVVDWLKALPGKIWGFLKEIPVQIWNFLKPGFDFLSARLQGVILAVTSGLNIVKNRLKQLWVTFKEKLDLLKNKVVGLATEIWNRMKSTFETIKDKVTSTVTTLINLPGKIWDKLQALAGMIAEKIREILPFGGGRGRADESVDDAFITKGGKVIRLNPDDNIFATQGGAGQTVNNYFYGVTQDDFIDTLKRELGLDVSRFGRF